MCVWHCTHISVYVPLCWEASWLGRLHVKAYHTPLPLKMQLWYLLGFVLEYSNLATGLLLKHGKHHVCSSPSLNLCRFLYLSQWTQGLTVRLGVCILRIREWNYGACLVSCIATEFTFVFVWYYYRNFFVMSCVVLCHMCEVNEGNWLLYTARPVHARHAPNAKFRQLLLCRLACWLSMHGNIRHLLYSSCAGY